MATRQKVSGLYKSSIATETWYPFPGIELGRAGGAVATITLTGNGGSGATATSNLATTDDGNGSDLTVNLTAASGVVTAMTVGSNAGDGYRIGDQITVSAALAGTASAVTGTVASLSYTN
jgi:hypothetical protein